MKKFKSQALALNANGVLTRAQMKNVGGGAGPCVSDGAPCPLGLTYCCSMFWHYTQGQTTVFCTCGK
jgi:hypothetical protein